ncbi:oligosaccharide flippase family protein [Blastococcus saxobsidens]|uniref:Oligosaccharide flippase family protein n=1 Tax=Blastococcus saxobsidens TaxID=138336 RepID=A0A6L9VXV2_9ACTN|nr:oligosaccharide flippase family protein [Blastococcus saxobsidens]
MSGQDDAVSARAQVNSPAGAAAPEAPAGAARGARTVAVLALAEVGGKVFTLVLLMYAVRELSPGEFGSFSYALAFGMLLAALPTWGLDALLVQQTGSDTSRLPGQYAQLLMLRTALALPVLLVGAGFGLATRPSPADRFTLVALLAAAVLESYAHAPRAVAGVLRRQSAAALVLVGQRLLTAIAGVLALAAGMGLAGLAAVYLTVTLVGTVALFGTVARMGVRPGWGGVGRSDLALTARRSVPVGIDALLAMLLFRADSVLLGWFHGDDTVAEYAAPFRVVETVLFFTWAVSRVVYPAMAAAADPPALRRALEHGLAVAGFVFIPFAGLAIVRGHDILALLFGDYYAESGTSTLWWLAPTPLLFAYAYLLGNAFVAAGRSGVPMVSTLIAATVNIVANLALLPPLASLGAAITTTAAFLVNTVHLVVMARRHLGGVAALSPLALPLLALLPALGIALLPVPVVPALLFAGVAYLGLWWPAARRWQPERAAVVRSALRRRAGR